MTDSIDLPHGPIEVAPAQHPDGPKAPVHDGPHELPVPDDVIDTCEFVQHCRQVARLPMSIPSYRQALQRLRAYDAMLSAELREKPDHLVVGEAIAQIRATLRRTS